METLIQNNSALINPVELWRDLRIVVCNPGVCPIKYCTRASYFQVCWRFEKRSLNSEISTSPTKTRKGYWITSCDAPCIIHMLGLRLPTVITLWISNANSELIRTFYKFRVCFHTDCLTIFQVCTSILLAFIYLPRLIYFFFKLSLSL